MKNLTLVVAIILTAAIVQSCNGGSTEKISANNSLQPNDSLFTVNQGGYNFQIILPKDIMIANQAEIKLNEATGDMHIRCGEQFWIVASQEKTDIPAIKGNINEDMLFTSRIIEETNNSILYQRLLPDGSEYDYNYRSVGEIAGKPYVFKTCEEGEFSMESVNRMKHAISSVQTTQQNV